MFAILIPSPWGRRQLRRPEGSGGRRAMSLATVAEEIKPLTISELTQEIKGTLEEGFPAVWVVGEVSGYKKHTSGHVYLTLKDAGAQLPAVLYRGVALRLRHDLRDGMEVLARGRINVFAPHGKYQLSIEEIQPKGVGAQEEALRRLKEKLFKLGYFAPERKKRLPAFPRRVALVTSPTGAAVRDMLEVLARRWPAAEVWVCPVPVQGDVAGEKIAEMVTLLNQLHACGLAALDVMVVGRGGGSSEDLWAFNAEALAHALFRSHIPVVSAVGHEIDVTLADGVADMRALTPTDAAQKIVPDRIELLEGLRDLEAQMLATLTRRIEQGRRWLDDIARGPVLRRPVQRIRDLEGQLDDYSDRLHLAIQQRVAQARERADAHAARLETLSPLNVLARGYSLTRSDKDLTVIHRADQVQPGDRLVTRVQHGEIVSRVESTTAPI